MKYREIVAVTGLGGLFHLLNSKSDGAIVRSLADNSTRFISSRQHNVTPLDTIEIYTTADNVRLKDVLTKMRDSSTARPAAKGSDKEIRNYFMEVYPDIDGERVYTSDMKKMLKWFDILEGASLLDFPAEEEAAAPAEDAGAMPAEGAVQVSEHEKAGGEAVPLVEDAEEKPAKKARAKKAAATGEEGEEKPAKKTAAKKKSAEGAEGEAAPKKAAKAKKTEDGE